MNGKHFPKAYLKAQKTRQRNDSRAVIITIVYLVLLFAAIITLMILFHGHAGAAAPDFFVSIWEPGYIIVRWESQPAGLTSVLCTVTDNYSGNPVTLYLNQFTWPNPGEPWGEWIAYHSFHGRSWIANCMGFLNQLPATGTAVAFAGFSNIPRAYVPMIYGIQP